jgi:predicted Zn-dependent peptidase
MNFKKTKLKNGLRIITLPMKDTPTATVMVLVEAGSKYETKDINGLSHFLEHMCFKGTTKRPKASNISRELDALGAQYNAFTSQEFTAYYAKAQAKKLPQLIDIVADMYLDPIFDSAEIEKEKGVIVEEINMYEDLPHRHVQDMFMNLLYGDQPAGWDIAGPRENVRAMTRDHFVNYRNAHYVARGTIVVVSGNIKPAVVQKQILKAFEKISTGKKAGKLAVKESQSSPAIKVKEKKTDQMHLVLGVRAFDVFDKKLPQLRVLGALLGGGMSSRLFHRMREVMGICYYVHASSDEYTDHGVFTISAGVDKTRLLEAVKAILEECRLLMNEPVPADELRKVKDYIIGNALLNLESSDAVANYLGIQEVLKGDIKKPNEFSAQIEKVTAKDIQKIARDIFKDKNLNLAVVGDVKDRTALESVLKF